MKNYRFSITKNYRFRKYKITAVKKSDGCWHFSVRSFGRILLFWRDILSDDTLFDYEQMECYFKRELKNIDIGETYAIF